MNTQLVPTGGGDLVPSGAPTNAALVYLASVAPSSQRTQRAALNRIAHAMGVDLRDADGKDISYQRVPWGALRFEHTNAIRQVLATGYGLAAANGSLSALRRVLKAAWRLGQMAADEYQKAIDMERVKGETLPAGRSITSGEIGAMLDGCANDPTPAGARDGAIIAILRITGMRRAELAGLDLADYDRASGALVIRHGKGNKQRIAYVVNGAAAALADWLTLRGDQDGPLFWPIRKGGHLTRGERLTTQAVWYILQARAAAAGVTDIGPHDFRRTFVGDLLDAGADISTVQKLAGHASVTTTQRYDRRPEAAKRKAVELLHVPYRGRRAL